MDGNLKISILAGCDAALLLSELWAACPDKIRRSILWDIPFYQRAQTLGACLEKSSHVGIGYIGGKPIALSWLMPLSPNCRPANYGTASIHFAFFRIHMPLCRIMAMKFLQEQPYKSLLALVPIHWAGARNLGRLLGFRQIAILNKSCWIANKRRATDGALYIWQK